MLSVIIIVITIAAAAAAVSTGTNLHKRNLRPKLRKGNIENLKFSKQTLAVCKTE